MKNSRGVLGPSTPIRFMENLGHRPWPQCPTVIYTKTQDTILRFNALTGITGKTQELEVHGLRILTRITQKSRHKSFALVL